MADVESSRDEQRAVGGWRAAPNREERTRRSLADWLRVLRDGWPAFLALMLLALAVGFLESARQEKQYGAQGILVASSARGFLDPQNADALPGLTGTVVQIAGTPTVLDRAAGLYADAAPDAADAARRAQTATLPWLRSHLTATQVATSSLIQVVGHASTQADAADLTRADMSAIAETVNGSANPRNLGGLSVRTFDVQTNGITAPTPATTIGLSGAIGLVIATVGALALGSYRRRLWASREIAEAAGLPIIGGAQKARQTSSPAVIAGARVQLEGLRRQDGCISVAVLAAGKHADSARVAQELAATLDRCVLVDADFSSRRSTRNVGLDAEPGLADALRGDRSAARIISLSGAGSAETAIDVLPAGQGDVASAMAGTALRDVLTGLARQRDYVIVAAPTLDRPDAAVPVTAATDFSILVVKRGISSPVLRRALEAAETVSTLFVGVILL